MSSCDQCGGSWSGDAVHVCAAVASPLGPCPKCGEVCWRWPPTYVHETWSYAFEAYTSFKIYGEHLEYKCACGYTVRRPCKDAKADA